MKINSLYPIIASKDPKAAVEFYKTFGFEIKHDITTKMNSHVYIISNGTEEMEIMEAVNDGPVNIPEGFYGLRMNVEDIDVAKEELLQSGATIVGGPIVTAGGNRNLFVKDNQGINITLIEHIRKKELAEKEIEKANGGGAVYNGGDPTIGGGAVYNTSAIYGIGENPDQNKDGDGTGGIPRGNI